MTEADVEPHFKYTEHGRILKGSLTETFGAYYAGFATLKGKLIRWYSEADAGLLSPSDLKSLVLIGDDIYDTKGHSPSSSLAY